MNEQKVNAVPDEKMNDAIQKRDASEATFKKCLNVASYGFTELYGEVPLPNSDVWIWYINEVFPTLLKLATTDKQQEVIK